MKVWILVFLFNGQIQTSGPHELEQCAYLAWVQPAHQLATCVNKEFPTLTARLK